MKNYIYTLLIVFSLKSYAQMRYDSTIVRVKNSNKKMPENFASELNILSANSNLDTIENKKKCSVLSPVKSQENSNYFIYGKYFIGKDMLFFYSVEHEFFTGIETYLVLVRENEIIQNIQFKHHEIDSEYSLNSYRIDNYIICVSIQDDAYDTEVILNDDNGKLIVEDVAIYKFMVIEIKENIGFQVVDKKSAKEIAKNHLLKMDLYKNLYIED